MIGPLAPKRSLARGIAAARPGFALNPRELECLNAIRQLTKNKPALIEFVKNYQGPREQFLGIIEDQRSFLENASRGLITGKEFYEMLPTEGQRRIWQRYQELGWKIDFLSATQSKIEPAGIVKVDSANKTVYFSLSLYPEHPSRIAAGALRQLEQAAPVILGHPTLHPYARVITSMKILSLEEMQQLTPPALRELKTEFEKLSPQRKAVIVLGKDLFPDEVQSLADYLSNPYVAAAPHETGRQLSENLGIGRAHPDFIFLDLTGNLLVAIKALGAYNREHNTAYGVVEISNLLQNLRPHEAQRWIIEEALNALAASNDLYKLVRIVNALAHSPSRALFQSGPNSDETFFHFLSMSMKDPAVLRPDAEIMTAFLRDWIGCWQVAGWGGQKVQDSQARFMAKIKISSIAHKAAEYFQNIGDAERAELFRQMKAAGS